MEKQKKISEAVDRMKILGLYNKIIQEFRTSQTLYYSEKTPLGGILYWVSNNPDWEKKITDFEEKYNALVYHVVQSYTEYGEMLSLLYVSDYDEEWELDREDLRDGYIACSYIMNLDIPEFSEFGSIKVKEAAGGLIRVWR